MKLTTALAYNRFFSLVAVTLLFTVFYLNITGPFKDFLSVAVPALLYMNFYLKKKIVQVETGSSVKFNLGRVTLELAFLTVASVNVLRLLGIL